MEPEHLFLCSQDNNTHMLISVSAYDIQSFLAID
jgi:hypothetical protein